MKTFRQFLMEGDVIPFKSKESKEDKETREYINSHREALDYPPIKKGTPKHILQNHMMLIDKHAPNGDDPWAQESKENRGLPPKPKKPK